MREYQTKRLSILYPHTTNKIKGWRHGGKEVQRNHYIKDLYYVIAKSFAHNTALQPYKQLQNKSVVFAS